MQLIGKKVDYIFHKTEYVFESEKGKRVLGSLLVLSFLISVLIIELNRQSLFTGRMARLLPTNHFAAIQLAFNLLLTLEVLSLVFNLSQSFANSVGKQFEVLSLILLRDTFKEFAHFSEPLVWSEVSHALLDIFATALGSVCIFIILSFYYRIQAHPPISSDEKDRNSFITLKRLIAVGLLIGFVIIVFQNFKLNFFSDKVISSVFGSFYTLIIFSDMLIVLVSMRYANRYNVAFRNSGFSVSTVMIRVALLAPPWIAALIGVGAALFATFVSYAYNHFSPSHSLLYREKWQNLKDAEERIDLPR